MNETKISHNDPNYNDFEQLFVNNEKLSDITAYLNRFNPIKVMKMEHMEIRHSAILAWLLDPNESHGFGDKFLKAFLSEAFKGQDPSLKPNAIDIVQSDLSDMQVRCEWQNIDIFLCCPTNKWALIVENKYYSKQSEGQLRKYREKVRNLYKDFDIRGILLTLYDEKPKDKHFVPIKYENLIEPFKHIISQENDQTSSEILIFLKHYLEVIMEATNTSEKHNEMKELAKQLYREHYKTLNFITEHGANSEFALAAHTLFGEDSKNLQEVVIDDRSYVFSGLSNNVVSFLPKCWHDAFEQNKYTWEGCENWWAGFPLIVWLELQNKEGQEGKLCLYAEVGCLTNYEARKDLISRIKKVGEEHSKKIAFQSGADSEGRKYSKFLKDNFSNIEDVNNVDEILEAMKGLLGEFLHEFEKISEAIKDYTKHGVQKHD